MLLVAGALTACEGSSSSTPTKHRSLQRVPARLPSTTGTPCWREVDGRLRESPQSMAGVPVLLTAAPPVDHCGWAWSHAVTCRRPPSSARASRRSLSARFRRISLCFIEPSVVRPLCPSGDASGTGPDLPAKTREKLASESTPTGPRGYARQSSFCDTAPCNSTPPTKRWPISRSRWAK